MSFKFRTLATGALALALGTGLVTQVAIVQPAFATDPVATTSSSANSTADAAADAQPAVDGATTGTADASNSANANANADASANANADAGSNGGNSEANAAANANANANAHANANPSADSAADASGNSAAAGETGIDPDPQEPTEPTVPELPAKPELPTTEAASAKVPEAFADPNGKGDIEIPVAAATGLPSAGFKAGYIISDANMYDGASMTSAQVQTFLNQQVARCTIGDNGREPGTPVMGSTVASNCLKNLKIKTQSRAANAYCKAYTGASSESAAQIIAKVGAACGVSPKVLLVRLQLEQSLVLDTWPTVRQYSFAMGWNCPDSGPGNSANCNNGSAGFLDQVYGSAWQVKRYKALPNEYRYKAYRTNSIQWHPNAGCGTSNVYIENVATAALYIYTPYRPNQAALNAGWSAASDACATYGNRNFYQYYKAWFGAPNSFFPDVQQNHKFFKEIEWMGTSGLSTGVRTANGKLYQPQSKVTREAMAAFLYRLEGSSYEGPAKSPFTDVKKGDKFYNEIAWMYQQGLSTGIAQPNGTRIYAPKDRVSREAMAAFIYRLQKANYTAPTNSPFVDIKKGDKFYREITWMRAEGLSTGITQPNGTKKYAPKDRVSREAMAAFIYRLKH